jgi:hypothetical protein
MAIVGSESQFHNDDDYVSTTTKLPTTSTKLPTMTFDVTIIASML